MLYDASKPLDQQRAKDKLEYLINNGKVFDLTEKMPIRSLSQNRYMHLIFSWFALETGYTTEEVKQDIFKKTVNPQIFYDGEKEGLVTIRRWRSTSKLDSKELTTAINRFRNYSSQAGIYLPEPNDLAFLNDIEKQIKTAENFL